MIMGDRIHVFTFATQNFLQMRKTQGVCSIHRGFDSFNSFSSGDLHSDFKEKNLTTLSLERGSGYWIWKPYIILLATRTYPHEEALLYLDSGAVPIRESSFFKSLISDNRIHVWAEDNSRIANWTDSNVLSELSGEEDFADAPMIWAGALLARNSQNLIKFLLEWQKLCENPSYLRPETLDGYTKESGYIWHRHDQSILSILVAQNPHLFVVHSLYDGHPSAKYFDRHRNLRIFYILSVFSFPKIRHFRRNLVSRLPKHLRIFLRSFKTNRQGRKLSKDELNSLKQIY
jgi:hypothetical protein